MQKKKKAKQLTMKASSLIIGVYIYQTYIRLAKRESCRDEGRVYGDAD